MSTLFLTLFLAALSAGAAEDKIVKVLPFFVDQQGRIAQSPSLFDRDAYQAELREHPAAVSALRYDILCRASSPLKLRLELRGSGTNSVPQIQTLEADIPAGSLGNWTQINVAGADYQTIGKVLAWHATLWNGTNQVSEQKSFLW
ncbi:MAG TPA: hypothetical protein VF607_05640 [Verrucomicrobiae bacterium]